MPLPLGCFGSVLGLPGSGLEPGPGAVVLGSSAPLACMTRGQCRVVSRALPPQAIVPGPHHQHERNSTRADIAQFYFRTAISVYPDMQVAMAPLLAIANKAGRACWFRLSGASRRGELPLHKTSVPFDTLQMFCRHTYCCRWGFRVVAVDRSSL